MERGVDGPLVLRPFVSFSLDRWEAEGARDGGLREEGEGEEEEEEEELRRTCEPGSARLRHGIFSRLTTGRDTLKGDKRTLTQCSGRNKSSITQVIIQEKKEEVWTHHVLFRAPFGG